MECVMYSAVDLIPRSSIGLHGNETIPAMCILYRKLIFSQKFAMYMYIHQ